VKGVVVLPLGGLQASDIRILLDLRFHPESSQNEIRNRTRLAPSTVSISLRRLQNSGRVVISGHKYERSRSGGNVWVNHYSLAKR
jgi:DNA-binding MarR family transcriptional regulator